MQSKVCDLRMLYCVVSHIDNLLLQPGLWVCSGHYPTEASNTDSPLSAEHSPEQTQLELNQKSA